MKKYKLDSRDDLVIYENTSENLFLSQIFQCTKNWLVFNDAEKKDEWHFYKDTVCITDAKGRSITYKWKIDECSRRTLHLFHENSTIKLYVAYISRFFLVLCEDREKSDEVIYLYRSDYSEYSKIFNPQSLDDINHYYSFLKLRNFSLIDVSIQTNPIKQAKTEINSEVMDKTMMNGMDFFIVFLALVALMGIIQSVAGDKIEHLPIYLILLFLMFIVETIIILTRREKAKKKWKLSHPELNEFFKYI